MNTQNKLGLRVFMSIIGVMLCAIAVSFFKCSVFGVDPFQCFAQGSHQLFAEPKGLSYGIYYAGLSFILLIIDFFLDKHYIGIATFINMFLTGYVVEFAQNLIQSVLPDPTLAIRAVLLIIGVVMMCFAASLYMTADLGVSVYDEIPIVISNKTKKPFKFCRIGCDLICVIIGALCGLMPGVGTIITAFFMGPLIEFFNNVFSRPILYGKGCDTK